MTGTEGRGSNTSLSMSCGLGIVDFPFHVGKRILDVLDKQLGRGTYVAGDNYSIADIAIYPWIRCLDVFYKASEQLELAEYQNVNRWLAVVGERPAVELGMKINNPFEDEFKNYSTAGRRK